LTGVISGAACAMCPMDRSSLEGQTYILRADNISAAIRWIKAGSWLTERAC